MKLDKSLIFREIVPSEPNGPLDSLHPALVLASTCFVRDSRLKNSVDLDLGLHFMDARPEACVEAGCYGSANACHLSLLFTNYANFSKICLLLKHEVIYTHASIYIHLLDRVTGVFCHGFNDLLCAETRCLEESPCQMATLCVDTDADDKTTGVVSPVGRKNSIEGWYKVDVTAIFDRSSKILEFPR